MSLTTFSKFYYGFSIDSSNSYIDFKEGATTYLATLAVGDYTLQELLDEVKRALEETGSLTYTVTASRTSRFVTIAATGTFSLLVSTGTNIGLGTFGLLGFTGADVTAVTTTTGTGPCGSVYYPQFILQEHIASDYFQNAIDVTVNKTSTGNVEAIIFGTEKFVQFKIMFATDINQGYNGPIKTNATGVADLALFMQSITTKAPFEYMANENAPSTFQVLILDSNPESSTGTGYKLTELYGKNLPGYFETSILKMRVIE